MNPVKRKQIFKLLARAHGKPSTELNFRSNFELLVAVILSAQATDISVNKATDKLFRKANTPQAILNLGLTSLKRHIRTIGLYNTKAQNIIKTCRMLIDLHNGQVPSYREALEALPGVTVSRIFLQQYNADKHRHAEKHSQQRKAHPCP